MGTELEGVGTSFGKSRNSYLREWAFIWEEWEMIAGEWENIFGELKLIFGELGTHFFGNWELILGRLGGKGTHLGRLGAHLEEWDSLQGSGI